MNYTEEDKDGCNMQIVKYEFKAHGDERGQLIALEEFREIPFHVKRIYYIFQTNAYVHRGFHAHRSLEQVLICVRGKCKVKLDDGCEQTIVPLDNPYEGLYVGNAIWREMFDFSSDAVLLVLASELYDEKDYIRDYDQFLRFVRENGKM